MVPWMGAIVILLVSVFRRDPRRRWLDFTTVIGYTLYVALGTQLTILLARKMTRTYDAVFFRADLMLGFNPVTFADAVSRHWVIVVILLLSYVSLAFLIGLAWALEQDLVMRRAVLLAGCICFVFYGLFPAVGPGHFDWVRQVPTSAPDNCMPSMHLTWALLIAWNARSVGLRIALWVNVALTVVSTLALREHYLVDLIAAVPYTIFIQWLARYCEKYLPTAKVDSARSVETRLSGAEFQS